MRSAAIALFLLAVLGGCSRERHICKVNDQCFVCRDEKSLAKCIRDPASARCKWTPPSECH